MTGGGSGIGRAIASEFARRGARVLVTDVDDTRAQTVADEIVGRLARGPRQSRKQVEVGRVLAILDELEMEAAK